MCRDINVVELFRRREALAEVSRPFSEEQQEEIKLIQELEDENTALYKKLDGFLKEEWVRLNQAVPTGARRRSMDQANQENLMDTTRPPGECDLSVSDLLSSGSGGLPRIAEESRTLEETHSEVPVSYVPAVQQPTGHHVSFQGDDQSVVESTHMGSMDVPGMSDYMNLHSDLATGTTTGLRSGRQSPVSTGSIPVLQRRAPVATLPEPPGHFA